MIVLILLSGSASLGLAIGLFVLRAVAIVLTSLCVALLSMAVLLDHGFGLMKGGLISFGSLTALQGSYLVGAWLRLSDASPLAEILRAARRAGGAKGNPFAADDEEDRYRDGLDPSFAMAKKMKRDSIVGATERRRSQRR
jgi:hypothetical protein